MEKGQRVIVKDIPIPHRNENGVVTEVIDTGLVPRAKVLLDGEPESLIFAIKYLTEVDAPVEC